MNNCPYCGKKATSNWRKLSLGPAIKIKCVSCGKKISVSSKSMLIVPLFIVFNVIMIMLDESMSQRVFAYAMFTGLISYWYIKYVEFIKKDNFE